MATQPTKTPSMGPSRKSPTARLPYSQAGAGPVARRASMQSTTIGSRMTSFIPLSSRSASLAVGGRAGFRRNERSSTGSVEASAAPRMAAAAGWRPRRAQAAKAMIAAGSRVPGPRISAARRCCCLTSAMSTPMASLKSTRTRPRVAMTCSEGESSPSSIRPSPAGPRPAPRRRKIATWGRPVRSIAPERSELTMMTMPTRASSSVKLSWGMGETCAGTGAGRQPGCRECAPSTTAGPDCILVTCLPWDGDYRCCWQRSRCCA